MAATNYTPIQLYFSTTASAVPTAANLAQGELAINITDGKLYYEDNAGVVQVIATKGAGTIGGSTTQIQYNNAGALAGSAAMVFNNSTNVVTLTTLNLTNALGAIYGGTAQSTYAQGDFLYASAANTLSKLGIGAANYILTSTGTVPQWVAPSSIAVLTATNLAGGLAGSVPYQSAVDTTTFLAIGAANRVMTSTGSAPQWVTSLTGLTGVSSSSITNTGLTSGRVVYSTTGGAQTDDADLTFDGTTLSAGGYSTAGLTTLVKTVKIGDSNFNGVAVFAPSTPAKLYIGTGTVTDTTSAIGATNAAGAISSLAITPIAATNTSVTYTNAATLYIAGAPSAGTNVTLTNPYSLYIAAGANYFGGAATFNSATTFATDITVNGVTVGEGGSSIATNTALGASALAANTSGAENTALGRLASRDNTTGSFNTAVGSGSLLLLTTGSANTAIGRAALQAATTPSDNTAIGYRAMIATTTGASNTALGSEALQANTTASNNTAVGYQAAYTQTTATRNTSIGYQAGYTTNDSYNVFVGWSAGKLNTGNSNVVVGDNALSASGAGSGIVAVGQGTLANNTSGLNNTALGFYALISNTTASNNTAVGFQAGFTNTNGGKNTFIGYQAGFYSNPSSATNTENTFVGSDAGFNTTTGNQNLFVGSFAGNANTTGTGNTYVGRGASVAAGYQMTTGSKNTILGGFGGNQDSLDIRTSNNVIVLSDGDGNANFVVRRNSNSSYFLVGPTKSDPSGSDYYSTISSASADVQLILQRTGVNTGWSGIGASEAYSFVNYSQAFAAQNFSVKQTDGTVLLKGGNTGATGTGITFPSTQVASSNANTLDDYEEGTWTPSLGGTATYNNQGGIYVKIGRVVYLKGILNVASIGTGRNNQITGLPFTPYDTDSPRNAFGLSYFAGLSTNVNWIGMQADQSGLYVLTTTTTTGNVTDGTANIFGDSSYVIFSGTYTTQN